MAALRRGSRRRSVPPCTTTSRRPPPSHCDPKLRELRDAGVEFGALGGVVSRLRPDGRVPHREPRGLARPLRLARRVGPCRDLRRAKGRSTAPRSSPPRATDLPRSRSATGDASPRRDFGGRRAGRRVSGDGNLISLERVSLVFGTSSVLATSASACSPATASCRRLSTVAASRPCCASWRACRRPTPAATRYTGGDDGIRIGMLAQDDAPTPTGRSARPSSATCGARVGGRPPHPRRPHGLLGGIAAENVGGLDSPRRAQVGWRASTPRPGPPARVRPRAAAPRRADHTLDVEGVAGSPTTSRRSGAAPATHTVAITHDRWVHRRLRDEHVGGRGRRRQRLRGWICRLRPRQGRARPPRRRRRRPPLEPHAQGAAWLGAVRPAARASEVPHRRGERAHRRRDGTRNSVELASFAKPASRQGRARPRGRQRERRRAAARAPPARPRDVAPRAGRAHRHRRRQRRRQVDVCCARLTGDVALDGGRRKIGKTVAIAHLTQEVRELERFEQWRVIEGHRGTSSSGPCWATRRSAPPARDAARLPGGRQQSRVGDLSGGERRRLQLTRLLLTEPNVLILDEPTNDLDIETLTSLEDVLDGWAGTLVVVSHDRYLLERVADKQLALLGDGKVREAARRGRGVPPAAGGPRHERSEREGRGCVVGRDPSGSSGGTTGAPDGTPARDGREPGAAARGAQGDGAHREAACPGWRPGGALHATCGEGHDPAAPADLSANCRPSSPSARSSSSSGSRRRARRLTPSLCSEAEDS